MIKCLDCKKQLSKWAEKDTKRCKSCSKKGKLNPSAIHRGVAHWNYRIKIKKICSYCNKKLFIHKSQIRKNNFCNIICRGNWLALHIIGVKHHSYKTPKKCKCGNILSRRKYNVCRKCCKEKNHPSYVHGNGYAPYPLEFNKVFKEKIRTRDNHICQNCGKAGTHIHHIDYNKQNCKETNLITTCNRCNTIANFNRDYWFAYFTYLMED
jgi:hypothetical protein